MKTKPRVRPLTYASLLALALAGCGGGGDSDVSSTSGSITVGVTDAPVDEASSVVIQFSGIEILSSTGEPIVVTYDAPKTLDLLDLQGGLRDYLLQDQALAPGEYTQIRLMVNAEADGVLDSYIEIDGAQYELRVPSGSETGLKLNTPFTVAAGQDVDFTVDFDLRKSVHQPQGQAGVYILRPTLRLIDTNETGAVAGSIDPLVFEGQTCANPPEEGYAVYVYEGADVTPDDVDGKDAEPVTTAKASFDGTAYTYKAAFLEANQYTVAVTCQAHLDQGDTDDADVTFVGAANVTVATGADTTHGFGPAP